MTYIEEARARARRRRSPWNLLLFPAVVVPLCVLVTTVVALANVVHGQLYTGESLQGAHGPFPGIVMVSAFIGALPVAMLVGNWLMSFVPFARRTLELEARGFEGTTFRESQASLLEVSAYVVPCALAGVAVGVVLPW